MRFIGNICDDEYLLENDIKGILIFGAGSAGDKVRKSLEEMKIADKIVAFCDNGKSRWGEYKDGIEILMPEKAFKIYKDYEYIIASTYDKEIAEQLCEAGIRNIHLSIF